MRRRFRQFKAVREWSPDDIPEAVKPTAFTESMAAFDRLPTKLRVFLKEWDFGIDPDFVCAMYKAAWFNVDVVIASLRRLEKKQLDDERKAAEKL